MRLVGLRLRFLVDYSRISPDEDVTAQIKEYLDMIALPNGTMIVVEPGLPDEIEEEPTE